MSFFFPSSIPLKDKIQARLLILAALMIGLYALILTISPAVRVHSWDADLRWLHWIGFAVWLVGFSFIHRLAVARLPERDPYLIPIVALLSGLGMMTIWRLDPDFGLRQTLWLGVSLVALGILMAKPKALVILRRYKYLWLTGGLLLTAITLIFGTYPGGSGPHLWLGCCGIYFQPSEFLKLLLVVYLAAYLADRTLIKSSLLSLLLPTLVLAGAALTVLVAQRDLGTAVLLIALYAMVTYLSSGHSRLLVISAALILLAAVLGYQLFDVIQVRIISWLNPWTDPSGRSYQIIQSLLAVASGGLFGTGPGLGSPGVVPVAISDFIFAAISEELGLTGSIAILMLWGLFAVRGLVISLHASNSYQRYLAAGVTIYFLYQTVLIISGNIRLLPLTGVTLPFMSYGGSSLLASFIGFALLLLVSAHPDEEIAPLPNPRPYLVTGGLMLLSLATVAVVLFYWGILRSQDLQSRAENPRWAIIERYVPRGQMLDRNNQPIVITTGSSGNYTRQYLHPPLSAVVGFSHPLYGQAGLEAFLDPYLRGLQGIPSSTVNFSQLFYAQTPPGLNVRLTLDLDAQRTADSLFKNKAGSLVLLNPKTGEILAMSSLPSINSNHLEENWDLYKNSSQGVFLNRATQGQYPPGASLGPFILASVLSQGSLPVIPQSTGINFQGERWDCALPVSTTLSWKDMISQGCPGAIMAMSRVLDSDEIFQLLHHLRLDQTPQINLPVAQAQAIQNMDEPDLIALGQSKLAVSPLQMALAAAALSSDGNIPNPTIVTAVDTPLQGWTVISPAVASASAPLKGRDRAAALLQSSEMPVWSITAAALSPNGKITWYLAGTVPGWKGTPLALALVLEENDPAAAQKIGEELMQRILFP